MNTYDLAKEFLEQKRYQIVEEDVDSGHIAFRYQMNTIHVWVNYEDENYFMMVLMGFADVDNDNIEEVHAKCLQISRDVKLVKMYTLQNVILASAELFYLDKADFNFQVENALKYMIKAKVMYKQLDE